MSKKILLLSNHYITTSFRKELIAGLIDEGHEVFLSSPPSDEYEIFNNKVFHEMGCQIIKTPFKPRGITPFHDLILIAKYVRIYRNLNPDIIFSFSIKPNIYGSIAAKLTKRKQICNITGTGRIFLRDNILSFLTKFLYRISIKTPNKVFFQNEGDLRYFINNKLVNTNFLVLPGSGVNLKAFAYKEMPSDRTVNFLYFGRIIKSKGIDQYLETARVIKQRQPNSNFYIVGHIFEQEYQLVIEKLHSEGVINFIEFQKDIRSWIKKCHCIILPTYGEGLPNTLLEASAVGRVCIASDVNGCKAVVDDGITGFLYEVGNTQDLIEKVEKFLSLDYNTKVQMGLAARRKVEREFDRSIVVEAYLKEVNGLI